MTTQGVKSGRMKEEAQVIVDSGGAEGLSEQQFKDRWGKTVKQALSKKEEE